MDRINVYAILPAADSPPEKIVQSLVALRRTTCPIVYIHHPGQAAPIGPDVKPIVWAGTTLGSIIETIRTRVPADLYLWVPPGVGMMHDTLDHFLRAFNERPEASLIVSNYTWGSEIRELCPLRDDLTEREDWGLVWGIPAWALEKIGGADPELKHTTFYDLRLRLAEVGPVSHIKQPTHMASGSSEHDSSASEALFFPGRGMYGGFSYLFMNPEEEREVEYVFSRCLKRRGAFIEPEPETIDDNSLKPGDPVVSVVIPVHNRASFLPAAVKSVLKGTFENFEILIVDNASTDNTYMTAVKLAKKDDRIRVLSNPENIIAQALNLGIRNARGKYIAQLDSDDEYVPETLEEMVRHLDNHSACGLAISYYELMDERGETLEQFGIIKHLEYNVNNILRVDGAGALRCWRKKAIERFGGFNETDFPNYGEDYDLVLKVGEHYDVDRVHKVLYRYRRHPGNTDALRRNEDKIRAKTLARARAVIRRREMNGLTGLPY